MKHAHDTLRLALLFGCSLAVAACGPRGNDNNDNAVDATVQDSGPTADVFDPRLHTDDDGDGYSEVQGDCNDASPLVVPFSAEICDDGIDNNCNGAVDAQEPDGDGDGFGPCSGDCDDNNPDISPVAVEVQDGTDNNCDGFIDSDYDGDGWTTAAGDCDDSNEDVNPDAVELCFDGIDNDCNGYIDTNEPDMDGDGFGPCSGDCEEGNPDIGPGQPEIPGDGIDNNCDNLVDADIDGDGWTTYNGDCDDYDPTRHPAALEVCGDGLDNNCNMVADADCLSPCEMAALLRSSVGCVYYAIDTNALQSGTYAVAISNVDDTATANVVVEVKTGTTWSQVSGGSFSVSPLGLQTLNLPHRYTTGSTLYAGGAYRITSDLPVIAYQFNPLDGSSSYLSDASLLLPRSALDTFYITPAWPYGRDIGNTLRPTHLQVVASATTQVRITSPIATVAGSVGALVPNVQSSFNLTEGDYLQLTVANEGDSFTGTYIESDAPIAVFTTNDCANVPFGAGNCCCEHLEEQIFGLQTWGTSYVAARAPQRLAEGSLWQILAQEDNTTISFDANAAVTGLPGTTVLNARQAIEFIANGPSNNPGDFFVSADKPILVTQYSLGCFAVQNGGTNGDPSMVQAVPVEQFLDQYVVLVPSTWVNDYLMLTRPAGATVNLDGAPVTTGWVAVGSSGYEAARVSVADGVHVLDGSAPFGVVVLGWDQYDSYAYPGGLDQQIINPVN